MNTTTIRIRYSPANKAWATLVHEGDRLVARQLYNTDRAQVVNFLVDHGMGAVSARGLVALAERHPTQLVEVGDWTLTANGREIG